MKELKLEVRDLRRANAISYFGVGSSSRRIRWPEPPANPGRFTSLATMNRDGLARLRYRLCMAGEATSAGLDLLIREMDFLLDSLGSTRSSVTTLLGLGVTVNLALAGLAFRDRRSPEPAFAAYGAGLLLVIAVGLAAYTVVQIRRAVKWPTGPEIISQQRGSAADLHERYLNEFRTSVNEVRNKMGRFDLLFFSLVGVLVAPAVLWIVVLANTPAPVP